MTVFITSVIFYLYQKLVAASYFVLPFCERILIACSFILFSGIRILTLSEACCLTKLVQRSNKQRKKTFPRKTLFLLHKRVNCRQNQNMQDVVYS
uniref:Secreted protein n=1 Tax=Anopheles arabiensis TaxID=7173 RepID=A0A182IG13_ANOAR